MVEGRIMEKVTEQVVLEHSEVTNRRLLHMQGNICRKKHCFVLANAHKKIIEVTSVCLKMFYSSV